MKNEHLAKVDAALALALANQGYSCRQIALRFPGASYHAAFTAIRRAIAAGGVLNRPRKMSTETFAGYTVKIWRAKQAVMRNPENPGAREALVEVFQAFEKAIL
jgi:hypothetical protein